MIKYNIRFTFLGEFCQHRFLSPDPNSSWKIAPGEHGFTI